MHCTSVSRADESIERISTLLPNFQRQVAFHSTHVPTVMILFPPNTLFEVPRIFYERMLSPSLVLRERTSSASGGVAEWAEGIAWRIASRPRDNAHEDASQSFAQQSSVRSHNFSSQPVRMPCARGPDLQQQRFSKHARPFLGNGVQDLVHTRPCSWSIADSAGRCYNIVAVAVV